MHQLFDGPSSLRDPQERLAFWLTLPLAFPAALIIAAVLHESIGPAQVALFLVGAMLYITLARGRLIGSSVMIHEKQYPRVFGIVKHACSVLEIPMPLIFAREDNYVPVAALGFGEPYALIISSHWIEEFEDDELAFMIGRELGHIAAGHTRYLSLLSVNGRENPIVALLFGPWLRRCTFTCDKVGLLVCGTFDAALRAIAVAEFHEFGRKVDTAAFAEQAREIESDSVLRWGTWLGSEPYATARIASLQRFMTSHAYALSEEWFLRPVTSDEPPALPAPGSTQVDTKDCAGWWRRFAALSIDWIVVGAIMVSFGITPLNVVSFRTKTTTTPVTSTHAGAPKKATVVTRTVVPTDAPTTAPTSSASDDPTVALPWEGLLDTFDGVKNVLAHSGIWLWLPVYFALLISFTGQTFGMMIAGLRVVTTDFRQPGPWRCIARAIIFGVIWWAIAAASLIWRRVMLHDRLSGTRVVTVERVLARITAR